MRSLTVVDHQCVVACRQSLDEQVGVVDLAEELAEGRQSSRAHPHDQVLVLVAVVIGVGWVQLPHVLLPVWWLVGVLEG